MGNGRKRRDPGRIPTTLVVSTRRHEPSHGSAILYKPVHFAGLCCLEGPGDPASCTFAVVCLRVPPPDLDNGSTPLDPPTRTRP